MDAPGRVGIERFRVPGRAHPILPLRVVASAVALTLVAGLVHASLPTSSAGSPDRGGTGTAALAAPGDGTTTLAVAAQPLVRRPDPTGLAAVGAWLVAGFPPSTAGAVVAASVPLGPPATVVYRVRTRAKVVALTFDDGWSPKAGHEILATLLRLHVPATFFVNAMYVHRDPGLWHDIAAAGFPIGNHTYDHRDLRKLSFAEAVADIRRDDAVFLRLTGYAMAPIFRPPYGSRNRAVDAAVLAAGYPTEVLWDVVAGDTTLHPSDAAEIAAASAGRPGSIVLMHVGPASTPRILAAVIARYRARGFSFVTVPQLLALRP